jgi:hypothetical protein
VKALRPWQDPPLLGRPNPREDAGLEGVFLVVDQERRRTLKRNVDLLLAEIVLIG